jgi:hypothetical protein
MGRCDGRAVHVQSLVNRHEGHDWSFGVRFEGLRGCMADVPVAFGAHLGNSHWLATEFLPRPPPLRPVLRRG